MNKALIEELKTKLEDEKKLLEKELLSIAGEPEYDTNYNTKFPQFGEHTSEQDENADEVEKYIDNLSVEHTLEKRLKEVKEALAKVGGGKYGTCEKCKKNIPEDRLRASPSAKICMDCQ